MSDEAVEARRKTKADIAASFQKAAVKHLEERTKRAVEWAGDVLNEGEGTRGMASLSCIVVAGGVAANATVRESLSAVASDAGLPLVTPPAKWCTDNGVMVAWAGVERLALGLAEEPPAPWLGGDGDGKDGGERREVPLLPRWPLGSAGTSAPPARRRARRRKGWRRR